MIHLPRTTRALLALTVLAAVGSSLAALAAPARSEGGTLTWALLFAAAVFGEVLRVEGDSEAGDPTGFTFSGAVLVAAAALCGPLAGGLIALAALGLVDLVRGEPVLKLAFNAVVYAMAGVWSALAFAALGGHVAAIDDAAMVPMLALVGVHAVVTTTFVGAVTGSARGLSPLRGIVLDARTLPPKVMEYSLGVILALQVSLAPTFTPLLLPLLLAVYRQHARSAALARETQAALRHLADIVDERDPYTYEHSERVGELVGGLATALRLPERRVRTLRRAGRLHDLGKIVVDATVLRKPGRLTDEEFEQLRAHPAVSARLLAPFGFAAEEARLVELHHERFDGRGYYAVTPAEIPLEAHFLILADAWDAMTSTRPYRPALSVEEAAARIREGLGTQFHPHLGLAFLAAVEGRDPAEELDPAQLRALRAVLTRRTRRLRRPSAEGFVAALRARQVRLLAAGAVSAALLAPLTGTGPLVAVPLAAVAAVAAAVRHRTTTAAVRRTVAALERVESSPDLPAVVDVVDAEYPLHWVGVLRADEAGTLRRVRSWASTAAPSGIETLVDGALRRLGAHASGGESADVAVAGRPLTLIRQHEGWTALLTDAGPLPDPVVEALSGAAALQVVTPPAVRAVPPVADPSFEVAA